MHTPDDPRDEFVLDDLALPLAQDLQPRQVPPEEVRRRLLARATAEPFHFVLAAEGEWLPHPVAGVRMKILSRDPARGYAMYLLEAPPHTSVPAHEHSGGEECLVLRGDVVINGRQLGPGDFHHAAAHTRHSPITTETGCLVLVVADERDSPA